MEKAFNKKRYEVIIKVVNIFLKWSIRFIFVLLGILLIGFIAVVFIPKTLLDFDMAYLEQIDVQFANVLREINGDIFTGIANVKNLILIFLFTGIINLTFIQFIQIQLKKVVSSVKDELPFRNSNAIILRNLGMGYILASVFVSLINAWLMMTIVNTFDVYEATINFTVNFQMLSMGVIILILAYVFSYGSILQEEHDSTV